MAAIKNEVSCGDTVNLTRDPNQRNQDTKGHEAIHINNNNRPNWTRNLNSAERSPGGHAEERDVRMIANSSIEK